MARLIDADAFERHLMQSTFPEEICDDCLQTVTDELIQFPTVEAVEVVRCKDCRRWSRNVGGADSPNGHCFCYDVEMNGYDFCSYGERRDDG